MTVAAIVVSYNRLELLRKCLRALEGQGEWVDEVILVDNGSTDGSPEMVRAEFPKVHVFETGKNLGGAGGFAWGIEWAIARGHDAAWLMDDDAEPMPDSLRPLVTAMSGLPGGERPAFAASLVVNDQAEPNAGHLPNVSSDAQMQLRATRIGGIAVESATFVGVLIDLVRARSMPLPYTDFFIWLDDAEYTRRLTAQGLGLIVPSSRILHPEGRSQADMGSRLYYYLRNSIWLTKLSANPSLLRILRRTVGMIVFAAREGIRSADKVVWIYSTSRGLYHGVKKKPKVTMPGELLATLPADNAE